MTASVAELPGGERHCGGLARKEVVPMTEAIGSLAVRNASSEDVRREAVEQGMRTLRQNDRLVVAGEFMTIGEGLRVIA